GSFCCTSRPGWRRTTSSRGTARPTRRTAPGWGGSCPSPAAGRRPRRPNDRSPMAATPIETDVLVVGGGVAGATTARLLAEAGHRGIVLDRAHFPRDQPCGEGGMPTRVRLLDRLGIVAKIPPDRRHMLRGVGFVVNGKERVRGDFPDMGEGCDRGMGVKRLVLDHQVLEHARATPGVEVHEGEPATDAAW